MRNLFKIMKNDYTIIFLMVDLILTIVACKKAQDPSVIGKWQENKVRIYQVGSTGLILNDTTYSGQTFTNLDYVQFNIDGSCVISSSHDYNPAGQGFLTTPQADQITSTWNFTGTWPKYIITNAGTVITPGFPAPADTATVSSQNNLLLHKVFAVYIFNATTTVFDAYYTR
jgi:hypothetical protein